MNIHEATEQSYRNGYEKGYADALGGWISVKERLPDEDVQVLVYLHSDRSYTTMDTDRLLNGKWVRLRWGAFDVTHWMPLPEAPKETNG